MLSARQLEKKILKDRYNSIIFEKGRGRELYLVGGYIRDTLMGLYSVDSDYIVSGDIKSFVQEIRNIFGGTVVEFKKFGIIRLALKEGLTFDFSKLQGTLNEDLLKRDFTINVIAWSPDKGIIDLYHGVDDIRKKVIRALSKQNIISDPLRMLRAYRFAAEMNGKIEIKTKKIIKILHNRIKGVPSERITLEFFNLLNSEQSAKYLQKTLEDGILKAILLFPYSVLENNIKAISKLESSIIKELPARIKVTLNKIFSQNLTYKGLLCLEMLLKDEFLSKKRIQNIQLSKNIYKRIELSHKGMKEFSRKRNLGRDTLFDIFMKSKEASRDFLIIRDRRDLLKEYDRFKKIWKNGLISSKQVINILKLKTGPQIGNIIREVKKAQFERKISSKRQAIHLVKSLINL